jgi:hypothetical protein
MLNATRRRKFDVMMAWAIERVARPRKARPGSTPRQGKHS